MSRLRELWRLLNLPCREISRLASESLDRELGAFERAALRSHVLYCTACRRFLRQISLIKRAMGLLAANLDDACPQADPGLPDELRSRIVRALKED